MKNVLFKFGKTMKLFKKLSIHSSYLMKSKSVFPKMKIENMNFVIPCSQENSYCKAAELLSRGQVIAVPTDTIYGLACSANCPEAIKKLYSIKGRDSAKPVAICVSSVNDVRKWGKAEHLSDDLLYSLLPGPITIVLEKTMSLDNPFLNPKTTKIGIRIPNHSFINKVTEVFNMPVALTSANFSNEPSTLSVHEFEHLYVHLGAVFDAGVLSQGLDQNRTGSTVVDLSIHGYYNVVRMGISCDKIVNVLSSYGISRLNC